MPVGPPTQKPSMMAPVAAAVAAGAAPVVLNGGAIAGIVIGGLVLILIGTLVSYNQTYGYVTMI